MTARGDVDGVRVVRTRSSLAPGEHTFGAGTQLVLDAGSPVPVVAGAPSDNDDWAAPGAGVSGGAHPLFQVYSLILATFLGTMGLPHVLVRFYTNPDGRAARMTSLAVIGLLGAVLPVPDRCSASSPGCTFRNCSSPGRSDAAVLLLPGFGVVRVGRATARGARGRRCDRGVPVDVVGTAGQRRGCAEHRRVARAGPRLPARGGAGRCSCRSLLALAVTSLDLSRTVGLVFAVAASTLCPLLVLGIWWRGLTAVGAAAGMVVGGVVAGGAALTSIVVRFDRRRPRTGGRRCSSVTRRR